MAEGCGRSGFRAVRPETTMERKQINRQKAADISRLLFAREMKEKRKEKEEMGNVGGYSDRLLALREAFREAVI